MYKKLIRITAWSHLATFLKDFFFFYYIYIYIQLWDLTLDIYMGHSNHIFIIMVTSIHSFE